MNYKPIIITLILSILLVSSCSTETKKKSDEVELRKGFTGLTIEFLKNTPPERVFVSDSFPVFVRIKNIGAFSIKDNKKAIISLGVEKDYTENINLLQGRANSVDNLPNVAEFTLEGKSLVNLEGDEEVVSYVLKAGRIDPQSEAHPSSVIATVCYPYETVLDTTVCIDTDVSNLRPGKKVCHAQDLVFSNGQGAPIAVTKVEASMNPAESSDQKSLSDKIKPQFLIYIENKGAGTAIKEESVKDFCIKSDTSHENLNIIYIDVFLSGKQLICQLEKKRGSDDLGHIKLKDKKDIIRCSVNDEQLVDRNQNPYLSPLKIVLNYGYSQSVSANYFIMKPVS